MLLTLALTMVIGLIVHAVQKSPSPERSESLAQFPTVSATWAEKKARNEGAHELANVVSRQRWAAGEIGFTHGAGLPLMGIALIWLGIKVHARLFAEGNSFASSMTGTCALVLIGLVLLFVALETVWMPVTDGIRHALGGLMVDYSRLTLGRSRRGAGGSNPYQTGQLLGTLVSYGSLFLWAKLSAAPPRIDQPSLSRR